MIIVRVKTLSFFGIERFTPPHRMSVNPFPLVCFGVCPAPFPPFDVRPCITKSFMAPEESDQCVFLESEVS